MIWAGEAGNVASLPLAVNCRPWLIAIGDSKRVEVFRSPVVRATDSMYEPVCRFIAAHGLVLAARDCFPDPEFVFGSAEVTVYVPPAARDGVSAGTAVSLPWHGAALIGEL